MKKNALIKAMEPFGIALMDYYSGKEVEKLIMHRDDGLKDEHPVEYYFSTYGVTDISNPRRTMMFTLFERGDEGLTTERLRIPDAYGIGVAKVNYNNVTVPAERMLAPPGEGYKRLFRGLTPE